MAKIVVQRDQQAEVRRRYPRPVYSRVVSFWLDIPMVGVWYYATTPTLGSRIWLLRATVRHFPAAPDHSQYTLYELLSGDSKANNISDIGKWDYIIPNVSDGGPNVTMAMRDGENEHSESMMRLYTGVSRRFGIIAKRVGNMGDQLYVSFEISEG